MILGDTSVERPKAEIWDWDIGFYVVHSFLLERIKNANKTYFMLQNFFQK
jgi:hypothetical protein